jgi:hypothetical protein
MNEYKMDDIAMYENEKILSASDRMMMCEGNSCTLENIDSATYPEMLSPYGPSISQMNGSNPSFMDVVVDADRNPNAGFILQSNFDPFTLDVNLQNVTLLTNRSENLGVPMGSSPADGYSFYQDQKLFVGGMPGGIIPLDDNHVGSFTEKNYFDWQAMDRQLNTPYQNLSQVKTKFRFGDLFIGMVGVVVVYFLYKSISNLVRSSIDKNKNIMPLVKKPTDFEYIM